MLSTDNESLIHFADQHSATPCTEKVRGWIVGEIKATRALGEHCSESQMQVALHASGVATQLKVGVPASLPSSSACGRKIWGNLARKLRFGIWMLSLEAFLRRNALAGLRHVNLEVHISWQAQRFVNLKVQITWQA